MCNIKEYFTDIKPCNNPNKYGLIGDGKDKRNIEFIAKNLSQLQVIESNP